MAFAWEASMAQRFPAQIVVHNQCCLYVCVVGDGKNAKEQDLCELKPFFFVRFLK